MQCDICFSATASACITTQVTLPHMLCAFTFEELFKWRKYISQFSIKMEQRKYILIVNSQAFRSVKDSVLPIIDHENTESE
jgi:hypothetical protein